MKNLTIITVLIILITGNAFAQNWNAVCVGINNYGDPENNLHWCVKDAIEMKEYLITYKQWSSGKITRLLDNDASESVIHTAIQNMPRSAGNTNLFSFSGHGNSRELDTLYGGSDGDGLYAPDWAMITPSELQADLGSTFNQSTAFLDACCSGIFPRVMTKGVISSACQADELAEEDYSDGSLGLEHGFFSYYLLDGLAKSSITTAEQLHNYAAPLTTALSNSVDPNYPMHPQLGDRFSGLLSIYNSSYTLSGVLPRNQHWSAPSALQGNVYVPSGVTLTLCADLVLNQNGYTIYSGGGTIIDQRPFGTISSNTTWDENKVLKGNVNVPSGVVLTIVSGVMVNFNGYSLTSTGGTIAIQSGGIITLNPATYVDITGNGSTYEVNGINVGASFNGIGQSIKAIPPSGFGVAGWSDGVGGNYREINGNITVNARLKALHKSNTIAAWDNTSQRKLIQTLAGGNPRWLHQVYTSAGHVWLEHSGDGGSTWTLGNNGQPLDGTAGGKCPSIAYTTHYTGSTTDNYIGVVWQEKDGTHYKIKGKIFNQYGDVNSAPSPYSEVTTLFTEPNDTYNAVNNRL